MQTLNYFVLYWKPFVWALIFTVILCLTNQFFVLPISGIYLIAYVIAICVSTTWLSFVFLQNFLQQNKPLKINFKTAKKHNELPDLTSVKNLTLDIDQYFIRKWFVYISNDNTFNEESRQILEEVLKQMVNVQLSLDYEMIVHGILNLYLKHLKEFRRGLKRKEKYGGKISDLYRYSHMCSDSTKAKNYFLHQLTINLLNHFINWELSNSLPYRVLVSIISKKVTAFVLNLLSSPEFLNYYILSSCASSVKKTELKLSNYSRVELLKVINDETTSTNSTKCDDKTNLSKVETKVLPAVDSAPKQDQKTEVKEIKIGKVDVTPVEPKKEPVTRLDTRYEDLKTEEVKIYEPKSCRTWYDSYDLEPVTIGQDILDLMNVGDSDKDVESTTDHDKDEMSPITAAKSLLDEVKQITSIEGIRTSMKPFSDATFNNIKDLQESTVNNVMKPVSQATSSALHKIGGLHLQDEAAGVVEGLLGFGRTKIRKGLRLTGLQDNVDGQLLKPSQPKRNVVKMPHVKSQEKNDDFETTWMNPLLEDLPISEDDKVVQKVPSISTQHDDISPEPEYEETADLATSIARLRSLLEQKSSGSNLSTPALSPMPPEEFSNKIFTNKILESEDVDEGDGVMPSFYKFCAKTATGVIHNTLNTIKTALPGNVADADRFDGNEKWLFFETRGSENDLFVRMNKLLSEREVFCTVDTAYEAISLAPLQQGGKLGRSNIQFEDELDDFEVKLPITKALLDILCELLADVKDTSFSQEPVIKTVLLLFGNYIEETIITQTNNYINYWCANAKIPAEGKIETLYLELDTFIDVILSGIPDYFKYLIGEKTLRHAANLFVSSLQVQKINQDMILQIFELLCMKLIDGSKQLSPVSA